MLMRFLVVLFVCMMAANGADLRVADAAQRGDRAAVLALLRAGAPVNVQQGDGMSALHWAVYHDDLPLIRALLKAGADWKAATRNEALTPLFLAAQNGSVAALEVLIATGADPKIRNLNGATPLMLAAASGDVKAVTVLLDRGAEVNAQDKAKGQTALMYAAALNRTDAVRALLAHGADPKLRTKVSKLERLRMDADGNVVPIREGESTANAGAPSGARRSGSAASTEPGSASEDRAAKIDAPKSEGGTKKAGDVAAFGPRESGATTVGGMSALLFAAREGHVDTVRALLDGGADFNAVAESDQTSPLVIAIINGRLDVAKLLLERGADPNLANGAGLTPLYATIDVQWAPRAWFPQPDLSEEQTGYLDLVKALLAKGAKPNTKLGKRLWFRGLSQDPVWVDSKGATAFWRAAQSSDVDAMRILAAAGADINLATDLADTPLLVASGIGWMANHSNNAPGQWLEAVKFCVEHGADVNAADSRGYTALHGAAYIGDNEVVQYLLSKGAKIDAKTKTGDTVADMANGPTRFGMPHADTYALLLKLGATGSNNCRSDQCLVAPKVDPPKPAAPAKPTTGGE